MERIIPKREGKPTKTEEDSLPLINPFRYYLRARLLYPKNGKSCKQLAILAVMTVRRQANFGEEKTTSLLFLLSGISIDDWMRFITMFEHWLQRR